MRKSKIYLGVLALALGSLFFTSCNDDVEQPVALDANADVFVQKIMDDGEAKFALSFFVAGNKDLESVTVKGLGENEEIYSLEKDANDSRIFKLYPEDSVYSTTSPELGDYKFTITSTELDEAAIVLTDELLDEDLGAIAIDTIEFAGEELKTTWKTVEGAENYIVRLYNESGDLIFISPLTDSEKTEFTFGLDDQGWIGEDKAEVTEAYKLELVAVLYESDEQDKLFNVQYLSIDSKEIVWGE